MIQFLRRLRKPGTVEFQGAVVRDNNGGKIWPLRGEYVVEFGRVDLSARSGCCLTASKRHLCTCRFADGVWTAEAASSP